MSIVYEFVNPSDAIEFEASSDEVAALAALVVGGGRCAATRKDTRVDVIGLALFRGDGGYAERYGRSLTDALTALATEVNAACHSFRIVKGERTSLNDWCGHAHSITLKGGAR